MRWIERLGRALVVREDPAATHPALDVPPRRPTGGEARSLSAVYRAIQVITTATTQLPLTVERHGQRLSDLPPLVRQPCVTMSRSGWVGHMTASLALAGNAFALIERDRDGAPVNLRPLDPHLTWVDVNPRTHVPVFGVEGRTLGSADVLHAALMPAVPGHPRGLGPIQAARADLDGALSTRDFAVSWFDTTGQPAGYLTTSNPAATPREAEQVRNIWNGLAADGTPRPQENNPTRVRVLGGGYEYRSLAISPKDAQWIESQAFSTLQVARLFGIPSTLMLASPDGGSMTYTNVEQDWIAFSRFTLMAYLRPLEEALTAVTVRGQDVRFNLEGLLRTDTATRYRSYATALGAGFLTVNEIRAIEGLDPTTPPQPQEAQA